MTLPTIAMSGSDSPTFFHGQPWSSWIERIGRDKPLSDEEPEAEPTSSVTRLSADDIDLYGFCPERDTFYGVVCEICNAIVKPQALIQHMESRHASSGNVNLPPPSTPASKTPVKNPYCKVPKLAKKTQPSSQTSGIGSNGGGNGNTTATSNVTTTGSGKINLSYKRNAEQANLQPLSVLSPRSPLIDSIAISSTGTASLSNSGIVPSSPNKSPGTNGIASGNNNNGTTMPSSSSSSAAAGTTSTTATTTTTTGNQPRRKRLKAERGLVKDREYDPDRHCGVWNEEAGKPCTRSLTCKAHTVSLRRTVSGRSKSFDKLLADHRASKELPNRTSKVTVTGTVTISSASSSSTTTLTNILSSNNSNIINLNNNNNNNNNNSNSSSNNEIDTPGSPPVLSLPDTYPLPKAVDLLYRCLAPHGSNKPTKLEEDFVNEEIRLEASLSGSTQSSVSSPSSQQQSLQSLPSTSSLNLPSSSSPLTSMLSSLTSSTSTSTSNSSKSMMAPISVVLPSLPPIVNNDTNHVATLIPATSSTLSSSTSTTMLPAPQAQLPNTVLEGETPGDIDNDSMSLYSPISMFKDCKSQLVMQIPRSNNSMIQSPLSRSFQSQASMPSLLFDDDLDSCKQQLANGKHINNHSILLSPLGRSIKRNKHDFQTEYNRSIQMEATTASTGYPHFNDITWSNCHPEPLAVSRWLRITSTRKQYNFNIH